MMMKISKSSCLVLLMLVSNTFAKTLVLNDVPDPPKKFSFRLPLARTAPLAREHLPQEDQETTFPNGDELLSVAMYKSSMTIHDIRAPLPLPVIKFKSLMKAEHPQKDKTSPQREEYSGKSIITPEQDKGMMKLRDEPATGVTSISTMDPVFTTTPQSAPPPPSPTITTTIKAATTTEDPWEAFCNEACQEGLAGPECDCAEHPIGRRYAHF